MDKTPLLGGGNGAPLSHSSSEAALDDADPSPSVAAQRTLGGSGKSHHKHGHSAADDEEEKDSVIPKPPAKTLADSSRSGHTPLLGGGKEAPIPHPPSERANHGGDGSSSSTSGQPQDPSRGGQPKVQPQDSSRGGQAKEHAAGIPKIPAAPEDDSSASGEKHDLNESSSQLVTKTRRFFPSAIFPFSLNKIATAAAANPTGSGERPLEGDCADLVGRLEELERCCSGSSVTVVEPTVRLIAAIRSIATDDGVDSRARRETQFEVILAAASLTMVASREKVPVDVATTSKKLASEATALLAKMGSIEPVQTGRSNDFLFCLTISGTLALLPYVSTLLPESLRPYVCAGFGIVFYAASAGAVLTFKATRQADLKLADLLNTFSFGLFSLLVLVFVCSALLSGNLILIVICAIIMFALHLYAWSRP